MRINMSRTKLTILILAANVSLTNICHAVSTDDAHTVTIGILWESLYVSQGRNNLEEDGLYSLDLSAALSDRPSFLLWYAIGDSDAYQELNLSLEHAFSIADFESHIGYTRLEFFESDEHDNELYAGVAYTGFPWVTPAVDYIYATEARGSYIEISLQSDISLFGERLILSPYLFNSFDLGYSTEDHDGPNHFQAGLEALIPLTETLQLSGYIAQSLAQEDVQKDDQGDLTWGGVHLVWLF